MEELIIYGLAGLFGGLLGWLFAHEIIKYCKKALEWFDEIKHQLPKYRHAIGVLIQEGKKIFKRIWTKLWNGEEKWYEPEVDVGVPYEAGVLPSEIENELQKQGCVAVWSDAA